MSERLKVCLVEDDALIRELLTTIFERNGYTVIASVTGEDAPALIEREQPSVVVTDVRLGEISGYDICAAIKRNAKTAHIKVVVVSGYENEAERAKATAAGADAFIPKLSGWTVLLQRVRELTA
jgi:two-component system cell cycle response regulator